MMYFKSKIGIFLLIILFPSSPCFGQNTLLQDSLKEVYITQLTEADTEYKQSSLLFFLSKLVKVDSLQSSNYQQQLVLLADKSEDPKVDNLASLSKVLNDDLRGDYAQQDELYQLFFENEYNETDSLLLAELYVNWAEAAEKLGDYDKALKLLDRVNEYIHHTDYVQEAIIKSNALTIRSAILRMDGKVEEAVVEIEKAIDILDKYRIKDKTRQQINKANLQYTVGQVAESYETFVKVADYTKKHEMYDNAIIANMNASFVSKSLQDIDGALKHNNEALELSQKIGHKKFTAESYLNISSNYSSIEDYDNAIENAKKAMPLTQEMDNIPLLVRNYYAVGSIYTNIDKRDSSIFYLNLCLKIIDRENLDGLQFYKNRVHRSLGMIYQENDENDKAIYHLEKYFSLVKDKADLQAGADVHKWLSNSYKATGQFEKALYHLSEHQILNDSLYNVENVRKTTEIKKDAEFEKEKEISTLKSEKEKAAIKAQRNQAIILGGSAGLLALLTLGFLLTLRKKNKQIAAQNKDLEAVNNTKDTLFQIIGHDLKKPAIGFRNVMDNINYLLDKKDYSRLHTLGKEVDRDAKSLYNLTDNLLNWALMHKDAINIKPQDVRISQIVAENIKLFTTIADRKQIRLTSTIENTLLAKVDKNSLDTIIRNLIDNAIKYTDYSGQIEISAKEVSGLIQLSVKDNGTGFPKDIIDQMRRGEQINSTAGTANETGSGIGLQLVKHLLDKNNGLITIGNDAEKGAVIQISIPKAS